MQEENMPQNQRKVKKGIRWYYKFSYMKTTYHSQAIYYSKQEAAKAERERYTKVEEEARSVRTYTKMNLLTLINLRLDYLKAVKTLKYYKENQRVFKVLYKRFGNIRLTEISGSDIIDLLVSESRKMKENNHDNYRVNAMIRAYKAFFNYGINVLDLRISNSCVGIKMFHVKKKVKYIPSDAEIEAMLMDCNPEQSLLIEFVRDTGCRISEALNLRSRDVFKGYMVLHTKKSKSSNLTPSEAKFNTSKLKVIPELDELVFKSWKDFPKFLGKKTKGKWTWHNLRHRYASILSKKNTPIFEIMKKLGHSNLETTQNYLQLLTYDGDEE